MSYNVNTHFESIFALTTTNDKPLDTFGLTPILKQSWLIMPLLRTKVNSLEEKDSQTYASKFLTFLQFISFIALNEKDGKLSFKFVSFKTLSNIVLVVLLFSFQIICIMAFEHETKYFSFGTIVEILSFALINVVSIIPTLQPMILRYVK